MQRRSHQARIYTIALFGLFLILGFAVLFAELAIGRADPHRLLSFWTMLPGLAFVIAAAAFVLGCFIGGGAARR